MKILKISISGVNGIENLDVSFDKSMNIVCGPNGIGKTTILESVAHCFAIGETNILKRHLKSPLARIQGQVEHQNTCSDVVFEFSQFDPNQRANISGRQDFSRYLISLKTNRTFAYAALNSINRDSEKPEHALWEESKNGINYGDVKNWFVNRYLYSAHPGALSNEQIENLDLAKTCFSLLNPEFYFSRVNASSNEIMVNTPGGEIYYEYLSSGFKSCLSILFGIIKEIEFRFSSPPISAKSFNGVVLIDEIELHLHPEWQYKIARVLTEVFPDAQFIVTTHSPHVIQSAETNQILALENCDGVVGIRNLPSNDFGFKGWTLDEVLTDVMGMGDTRTEEYIKLIGEFNRLIDEENFPAAQLLHAKLDGYLHPSNYIRKLLRMQLASISEASNDQA